MKKKLFEFQSIGANFLAANFHFLLADEPGLGKTVQAIMAVERLGLKNILVVCPASVRLGWLQEINECQGSSSGWSVISYNGATSPAVRASLRSEYDAIILDEAHFLKTPDSQRTQAIFGPDGLARRAKFKWCLTGTPILNRPRELYPMLKSLHPDFSKTSFTAFAQRYCGAFFDGRMFNTRGATNLDELGERLKGFMLRRTKTEVMPQLPPKVFTHVPLTVSNEDLAEVLKEEALISDRPAKISSISEDFSQLGDMSRLLRLTGEAKVRAASEFLLDMLDGGVEKIIVFAKHREVIRRLEEALILKGRGVVVYHGGLSDGQKQEAVKNFQGPEVSVFIGQIQTAGTGINGLQNVCSRVVFAELSWVPGETGQAIDRSHRIGQKADSVDVFFLQIPGTLESAILNVHKSKEKTIAKLLAGAAV